MHQKALSIRVRVFSRVHRDVAATRNSMGEVYRHFGRYKKWLLPYGKAQVVFVAIRGRWRKHLEAAATLHNMAIVYRKQSKLEKALEFYQKALDIRILALVRDHPDTAATLNNMGIEKQGKYEQALEAFSKRSISGSRH
jgi:tetratricopeptide (TPR) repeat protein